MMRLMKLRHLQLMTSDTLKWLDSINKKSVFENTVERILKRTKI